MSYIQFDGVSKTFSGKKDTSSEGLNVALQDMDIGISRGEFIVIIGPSGCGKSTALNLLAGFELPSHGKVLLDSIPVSGPSHERGVIFQDDALFPWLTVQENILFGPHCRRLKEMPDVHMVLDLIGLEGFGQHYPQELSGGMRQRVALARVLVNEPDVLLMDEPFGALDAQTRESMQELISTVHTTLNSTIIFVTHDVEEAVYLADRVLVMSGRPGRIIADIAIGMEKPRSCDIRDSEKSMRLKSDLRHLLKQEK